MFAIIRDYILFWIDSFKQDTKLISYSTDLVREKYSTKEDIGLLQMSFGDDASLA